MKQVLYASLAGLVIAGALSIQPLQAASVSGAIFTTTANGSVVNANQYSSKCEVYLDGGPGNNAPAGAAGLPDGLYYFQVTDPSGKILLSTDPVSNRAFQVTNGVIVSYMGTGGAVHPTGYDQDHPELRAITIRLGNGSCPTDFADSPNGVYKVWATAATDFVGDPSLIDNPCGSGCFHGFVPSKSKTDNFSAATGTGSFCITVWKRLLDNFSHETPGAQWPFQIADPTGVVNSYYTDSSGFLQVCGLTAGTDPNATYTVQENAVSGYTIKSLWVNGVQATTQPVYTFQWSPGDPEPVIVFKNGTSGGPVLY